MKIRTIVTLSLLFVMSFSFIGEHILTSYSSQTYTTSALHESEFDTPVTNVEVHCEIHCEYHLSYLLPQNTALSIMDTKNTLEVLADNSYLFQTNIKISKPPTS